MAGFMRPLEPITYAALRIVAGFLMLCHGSQKLLGFPPSEHTLPAFIQYGAGPIELIGGLLVMIGVQTRWAAFLVSGTMAAAYWIAHGRNAPLPIQNGGELAAIYCFVFLFISSHGAGIWALDKSR
jgi:putative oxidoreductase